MGASRVLPSMVRTEFARTMLATSLSLMPTINVSVPLPLSPLPFWGEIFFKNNHFQFPKKKKLTAGGSGFRAAASALNCTFHHPPP